MSLFGCDHESEIQFLREQVKTLTEKLADMADPLINARLARAREGHPRPLEDKPKPAPISHSIQALRRKLADRQPVDGRRDVVVPDRDEIERSFEPGRGA
jgi:hypothetical protein